jgi:hypothetical protein
LDRLHAVIVMKAEDEWVWYMYNCCYNEGDGIQSQEKMRRWKQDDRAHCIHRPLLTKYTSYELDIINLSIAAERKEYHSISTSHTQRRCTSFHSKREATEAGSATHTTGKPFNNSSTSSSVIFSPNCVNTYRSSPTPILPRPSLSNTWKPLTNSSTVAKCSGRGKKGGSGVSW